MEKVINRHIVDGAIKKQPLSQQQYAYMKGKSTEKVLEDKEITLCTFFDIEGAFDNTGKDTIVEAVRNKGIDTTTTRWIN